MHAVEAIAGGEVVAVKGGHIIDGAAAAGLPEALRDSAFPIAADLFVAALTDGEYDGVLMRINHPCEPNAGMGGNVVLWPCGTSPPARNSPPTMPCSWPTLALPWTAAVVGLVIILPVLVQGLQPSPQAAITKYLPSAAGQAVIGPTKFTPPGHLLPPWAGFAVFCAYTAAVLTAAALALHRRDA